MEQTTEHQTPSPEIAPRKTFFQTGLGKFIENVLYIIGAVIFAAIIQAFLIRPFIVSGTSMDPVIKNGQYLIIDEVTYHIHTPERGDVIVFKAPPEPSKYYIKRVIGLPGDTVKIKDGKVTIVNTAHPDGFTLNEPYLTHLSNDNGTFVVTQNNYFVMGDNRTGSYDSRSWGMLPIENIRGRAVLRLLPVNTVSVLPGKETYEY
ncbi:MAG: signal peptidase I [Candidatus Paceibacterota bacterium]